MKLQKQLHEELRGAYRGLGLKSASHISALLTYSEPAACRSAFELTSSHVNTLVWPGTVCIIIVIIASINLTYKCL